MASSFLYKWFGWGGIPKKYKTQIESEGILLSDEGLSASVTFRKFKAPGKRYGLRNNWFLGCLVLTRKTFLGFSFMSQQVGVPLDSPKMHCLDLRLEDDNTLHIGFEANDFNPQWSGKVELRYRTDKARKFLSQLREYQARAPLAD